MRADVAALDAGTSALQADRAALKRDVADLEAEVAGSRVDGSATKAGLHRLALVSSVAVVGPTVAPMALIP